MITHSDHSPGDFCWMDLETSDPEAAAAFYGAVFGWEFRPWPVREGEEAGSYEQIRFQGAVIGGMMRQMDAAAPPSWSVFFAVQDADAAAERVSELGGRLLVEPMLVPGGDRVAFFADPNGAPCGIFQAGGSAGVELTMAPGTVCWVEAGSRDPEATRNFYGGLFDWSFDRPQAGEAPQSYSFIRNGDRTFGGLMEMDDSFPEAVGSYWMPYIGVEDLDATLAALKRYGGQVGFGPTEMPDGTLAVVSDPQGAHFAVIQPSVAAMARAGAGQGNQAN